MDAAQDMTQSLGLVSILVADYDEAIDFFTTKLGFDLVEDSATTGSSPPHDPKRWVVVRPPGKAGTSLLLAKAEGPEQRARIGDQTGGRVFLFLETHDFWRDYDAMREKGVRFVRGAPRVETYGTVAVFEDVSGNLWDLIETDRD